MQSFGMMEEVMESWLQYKIFQGQGIMEKQKILSKVMVLFGTNGSFKRTIGELSESWQKSRAITEMLGT